MKTHYNVGKNNGMYGKHHTKKAKTQISIKHKGLKRPDLAEYNRTHPMKGKLNPNFNKIMTEKQKREISKTQIERLRDPKNHSFYGKKHKQSSKIKMKLFRSTEEKIYTTQGYVLVWNSKDKTKRERILEHRLIAQQIIKRKLTRNETIHHINEIKLDNRPENLYLFKSKQSHNLYTRLYRLQPELILTSNLKDVK